MVSQLKMKGYNLISYGILIFFFFPMPLWSSHDAQSHFDLWLSQQITYFLYNPYGFSYLKSAETKWTKREEIESRMPFCNVILNDGFSLAEWLAPETHSCV